MPFIEVITPINAPIERCFNLSRSIDFHIESTSKTNERAIGGKTSGLIELYDTVTFSARHLGFRWNLTSRIIEFDSPNKFTDQMLKGPFKKLLHEHKFKQKDGMTIMTDSMEVESPFGLIGRIFDFLVLKIYMERFLKRRCNSIKDCLESDEWKKYVTGN